MKIAIAKSISLLTVSIFTLLSPSLSSATQLQTRSHSYAVQVKHTETYGKALTKKQKISKGKTYWKKNCKVCHGSSATQMKGYKSKQIKTAFKTIPDMALLDAPNSKDMSYLVAYFASLKLK